MIIRSFKLVNEFGQEYDLNSAEKTGLLTEPQGLGYDHTVSYIDIGDAFIRTKKKAKQGVVSGTLIFGGKPYEAYNAFNGFVRNSKELRMIYKTPGSTVSYYRDVDLVRLVKTEMEGGVLHCPVEFYCKSLFYSNVKNNFTVSTVEGELRYDIRWPAKYNDYSKRAIMLSNSGDVDAPFTLVLNGYCENPVVTLSKNGEVVASVKFPVILQVEEKILYSSLDDNMYVYLQRGDGTKENIVQLLDINYDNFFKIPTGDCAISFESDTGATYTTSFEMYKFYRTV